MTGPTPQTPVNVEALLLELKHFLSEETRCLVSAGLCLLSVQQETANPAQFQAFIDSMPGGAQRARDAMLVARFVARAPVERRTELLATDFDGLVAAARFVDCATLGAASGGV